MITFALSRGRAASVSALVVAMSLAVATPVSAQDDDPLLEALRLVPSSSGSASNPVSFVDYHAMAAARPGALEPGSSLAELLDRHEAGDPAADVWIAALMGVASGPPSLVEGLMSDGVSWPESMGFDFVDIERAVGFGTPPSQGTVLLGAFDTDAIEAAHAARGYTSTAAGG